MSKPVRIRIRCAKRVRELWMETKGKFDLSHAEFAMEAAQFIQEHENEFRRHLQSEGRTSDSETRK